MAASMSWRVFTLFFAAFVLALFAGCEGRNVKLMNNEDEIEANLRVRRQATVADNNADPPTAAPAKSKLQNRSVLEVIMARGTIAPFYGILGWCIIVVIAFIAAYIGYRKFVRKPEDDEARRQRLAVAY